MREDREEATNHGLPTEDREPRAAGGGPGIAGSSPVARDWQPDTVEALAKEFRRRQVTPEPVEAILAVLVEDLALKRYRIADLRLVVEALPAIDARAWRLRERVPALAAAVRRDRFLARLAAIQAGEMVLAWRRSAPSVRARVDLVDIEAGWLVLCEWSSDGRGDRRVIERLEDLEPWAFAPEGATLFPLGDGPPPAQAGDPAPRQAVRLPEDPAARAAAERLLAAIGRRKFATWFSDSVWMVQEDGSVCFTAKNAFLADYLRSHFAPQMTAAGVKISTHANVEGRAQ
jgi:hypothetical protein